MSAVIGDNMPRIDVLQNCFQVEDIRSQSKGIDFKGFLRVFADLKNPDRMEREAAEEDKRKRIFLNIARTSLLVMFIFLPTSSSTIFQAFGTETFDDGTTRLRSDYSVIAKIKGVALPTYRIFVVYSWVFVFVIPIGIPLFFWVVLWRNRQQIQYDRKDHENEYVRRMHARIRIHGTARPYTSDACCTCTRTRLHDRTTDDGALAQTH